MSALEKDVSDLKIGLDELRVIVRDLALSQQRTESELRNFKEYVLTSQKNWEKRFEELQAEREQRMQEFEERLKKEQEISKQEREQRMREFEAQLQKRREEYEQEREQRMQEFEERLKKEREEYEKKREQEMRDHRQKIAEDMKAFEARLQAEQEISKQEREQRMREFEAQLQKRREEYEQEREQRMQEFEERLKKEREEYEKKREQERQEWKNEKREMNKKWGELANKMGTLVEDIVAPNIRRLAEELFDVGEVVDFSVRRIITHPKDKSRFKDFDALFIGSRGIILNETKSTVRQSYIDEFIAFIPTVFEYLPEHQGKKVIPVFSSLYIPENFVRYLTKHNIYALAMGDETMEVLNYHDIPKL